MILPKIISLFSLVITLGLLTGCHSTKDYPVNKYNTVDYVEVGKVLPNIETPYVIDLSNGSKRLVFIGCSHTRDATDKQYSVIEDYFRELQPQIAFNEGGEIPDSLHFKSKSEAIERNAETGLLKYLCDASNVKMLNGDISDSLEFSITLKQHPKEDLFLYYMMERLVVPYLNKAYGERPFESLYNRVIESWFVRQGFPLAQEEKSLTYFKELYQKKIGHSFVLEINEDNFEKFDYINGGDCKLCKIGRTSKKVRDEVLLDKIDEALDKYDRVIVTFGHGHALAVEPALKQIIAKERK